MQKLYEHIMMRRADANVPFEGIRGLLVKQVREIMLKYKMKPE